MNKNVYTFPFSLIVTVVRETNHLCVCAYFYVHTSIQVLEYLQLLNDVLVVPGVDGSGWSGRAG